MPMRSWELSKGITYYNGIRGMRDGVTVYEHTSHSSNIKPLK